MSIGVQAFRGERLTQARLARGLFKKSLADLVGISGTAIARYEEGVDKPTAERLSALAEQLKFPEAFFLKPAWHEKLESIFWRSRATETKSARDITEQRMIWLCEVFRFLQQEVDFPEVNLPDIEMPNDFRLLTQEDIERAAASLRDHWRLRTHPIPDVCLALENAGIPVVNLDMVSYKQDGFFFRSQALGRAFVGINIHEVSAARARFDAAHELGHAVLHRFVTPQQERDPALHKLLEQQAHRFAAAFLFPRAAFLAEVGSASLDYFASLKKRWGISIGAMIFRAHNLGIIDDAEKANLQQNMGRRRWRGPLREPFDAPDEMKLEHPRMLRRGIEAVINDGIFDRRAILATRTLPQGELEELCGLQPGFFSTAEILPMTPARDSVALRTVDLESGTVLEFPHRNRGR